MMIAIIIPVNFQNCKLHGESSTESYEKKNILCIIEISNVHMPNCETDFLPPHQTTIEKFSTGFRITSILLKCFITIFFHSVNESMNGDESTHRSNGILFI